MQIEICHKTRLKSKSSYNLLSSERYRVVSETSKVSNFLWWDKWNNFRKKNIGARMLLSYERVQRVNKDTPSHTIIHFTQLWDFRTDF